MTAAFYQLHRISRVTQMASSSETENLAGDMVFSSWGSDIDVDCRHRLS